MQTLGSKTERWEKGGRERDLDRAEKLWVLKAGLNNNWLSYRTRVVWLVLPPGRLKSEEFRL